MKSFVDKCLRKNDEKYMTQYLAALTASMTYFTVGAYQGWTSPSLIKILSDEYPLDVNQEEASIVATIGSVGHIMGGFLASYLLDVIGRKSTIMSIGIPQIIFPILIYFSHYTKYLLYFGRITGGMGEGASIAVVSTYIAEIAVPQVRGSIGGFTIALVGFGTLTMNIAGSYLSLKEGAIFMLLIPVIFWICFIFMPESPYYYIIKNKPDKARESLKILRRKFDVEKELSQLTIDIQKQMAERGTFRDLIYVPLNRYIMFLVTAMRVFQLFTGYNAFTFYSQIMISQTTNLSPVMGSSLLLLGGVIILLIGTLYVDKIGRRPLFLISMVLSFIALISMAVFLAVRDYTPIDLSGVSFMPLVFIVFYNVVFCGGLGIGVNIFIAEILPSNIRAKGLSIASIVFACTVTGTTKLYQYTADYIGASVPFFIFAGVSILGIFFIYFLVPETKGKTLGTIQNELRGNKESEYKDSKKYPNQI
ncbi:facilitated trehalose transporter Tret1-like [Sitophilus oryzae]|uniref:Facilitated trehalose transporter Tret1-like n=1 Tax=Sitophilus oryzae TaxID=7048 RepID=A0A6J2YD69_SITOR|nr:facilitated trehalose transporter Tret1-like [Sitophilus oryzae]